MMGDGWSCNFPKIVCMFKTKASAACCGTRMLACEQPEASGFVRSRQGSSLPPLSVEIWLSARHSKALRFRGRPGNEELFLEALNMQRKQESHQCILLELQASLRSVHQNEGSKYNFWKELNSHI